MKSIEAGFAAAVRHQVEKFRDMGLSDEAVIDGLRTVLADCAADWADGRYAGTLEALVKDEAAS